MFSSIKIKYEKEFIVLDIGLQDFVVINFPSFLEILILVIPKSEDSSHTFGMTFFPIVTQSLRRYDKNRWFIQEMRF